jgi:hypothetical protein
VDDKLTKKKKKKHILSKLKKKKEKKKKPNTRFLIFLFFWKWILLLNEQGEAGDLTTLGGVNVTVTRIVRALGPSLNSSVRAGR